MADRDPLINRSYELEGRQTSLLHTYLRPCLAEFFGTMLFVFLGTMATNNASPLLSVAIAHAIGLAALVATMAKVSGGHFNPAVSLGVFLAGEISALKTVLYSLSQLVGGITGAGVTRLALPYDVYVNASGGGTNIGRDVTAGEAIVCEGILTAVLVTVVLLTAVDAQSQTEWAPLAIGLSVGADILAGGAISGASMNPARSFGPAVVASSVDQIQSALWSYHYVYWVGPALGACFSALWYRLVFAGPQKNFLFR